ncbi:hypothetical protein FDP41_009495 [Naegleria fowleri]|uniref:Uncharacterized protein n=1 Tax=Naegleria fowleri TaxID=5763 RepID=A0A6A5B157_NAEFO|nr:uncharacterized protein FDP41_009495 [Naegleria fowleri]KAF0972187.1 hypothetical protein FDP41_009495 [Naegleria fowleri]
MQQRFDLMLLLFASSGVLLSFILIRMDTNSKHETDPLITRDLSSNSEHSILFFIHMFLKSVGMNHVKFFQWRALMEMKHFYLISLAVHSLTAICWVLLLYFGGKNSGEGKSDLSVNQKQQQKKNQKSTSSSSSFSWVTFVLNAILILGCVSMLFILSLVYLPLIKNGIQMQHHHQQ